MDCPIRDPEPFDLDDDGDFQMAVPSRYVDVVPNGDAMLLVRARPGTDEIFGLRVSSQTLSLASSFFANEFAITRGATDHGWTDDMQLPWADVVHEGNSYAWLLCMYIMHFRHDLLPPALEVSLLLTIAHLADRYSFVAAISWSTATWFDHIYQEDSGADIFLAIEAAMLLDQATYFSRLTSRVVLYHNLFKSQLPDDRWRPAVLMQKLTKQRSVAFDTIRRDMDFLLEPVAIALSRTGRHWIDYAPNVEPEPEELIGPFPPERCLADPNAAINVLSSLSTAAIWPSFSWPERPGEVVDMLLNWHMPAIDQGDFCTSCLPLHQSLERQLITVRALQRRRLWGLCLDCYNQNRTSPCRVEHYNHQLD